MPDTFLATRNKHELHKEKPLPSWSMHCGEYRPTDSDASREKQSRKGDRKFQLEGSSIINKSDSL